LYTEYVLISSPVHLKRELRKSASELEHVSNSLRILLRNFLRRAWKVGRPSWITEVKMCRVVTTIGL